MKLGNKGFAISSIMYLILIMAIILVSLTLAILSNRKLILDKIKNDVINNLNNEDTYDSSSIDVVLNGLVPISYDGSDWVIVNPDSEWYDYSKQKWANAVILSDSSYNHVGNIVYTTGDKTNIKAMFVYVPRYEYKIDGQYGKNGISNSNPGEIEINFISKGIKTPSNGYIIHPAFKLGYEELPGIWVGKFETTGSSSQPTILPSVSSLRNLTISDSFSSAKKFNSYLSNSKLDIHMAKNSEWGAVACLSQSRYGKYGNNEYDTQNKEIMNNNCSNYVTGISANDYSEAGNYDVCTENYYYTSSGISASTTGNIYGIYDMSGGAKEFVMAYYETDRPIWGSANIDYALFESKPHNMYYDDYNNLTNNYYGQASKEVQNWYSDSYSDVDTTYPWLTRGGIYSENNSSGVFNFSKSVGSPSDSTSFRVVAS